MPQPQSAQQVLHGDLDYSMRMDIMREQEWRSESSSTCNATFGPALLQMDICRLSSRAYLQQHAAYLPSTGSRQVHDI